MTREYFKNPYRRKKKTISSTKSYEFECRCCKQLFISQGRFSNKDVRYKHYCSTCRKVCFMCRCRHGGRGNTCSKYCADKYKILCWHWKLYNTSSSKKKLDAILTNFDLNMINMNILKPLFGLGTTFIKNRCKGISEFMIVLQDHRKLESIGEKLIIDGHLYIDKNNFYLYKNSIRLQPIEKHK